MRFSDVQHQDRALSIVRRALACGRSHHAYLFDGPEGVGKELAARALAARLLCDSTGDTPDADACGGCRSCVLFASGNHPDFHLIHRGLHRQHPEKNIRSGKGLFLVVDVIRHFLIEPASSSPSLGRRRVFIIRDAERMNEGAQNALLKTLEEPPGSVCLILVTASAQRLLPTIRSRCQRIPFNLLPPDFVEQQLQTLAEIEPASAHTLAALSQGRLGAALQWHNIGLQTTLGQISQALANGLLDNPETFAKTLLEIAGELAIRTVEQTANFADEQTGDLENGEKPASRSGSKNIDTDQIRSALKLVFLLIAAIYRDALIESSTSAAGLRVTPPEITAVGAIARHVSTEDLAQRISAIATAETMLDRNVAPQLTCEHLAIALAGALPNL